MFSRETDHYIEKSAEFAQPILNHLRELVHSSCPGVTESIKWGFPHFDYMGKILCNMAAFKKHCAFGFWYAQSINDGGILQKIGKTAMGQLGRIESFSDLPDDDILRNLIIQVADKIRNGEVGQEVKKPKPKKAPAAVPEYLAERLRQNSVMAAGFDSFTDSQRREYIDWFEEAKTEATRDKRLQTAEEWIMERKIRNWKYMKK